MGIHRCVRAAAVAACLGGVASSVHAQDAVTPPDGESSAEITAACRETTAGASAPDERARFVPGGLPAPLGLSLTDGWLDEWPHSHFSRRGTPFTHLFLTEPAFLDRDVFLDAGFRFGDGAREIAVELEVEWALTRRIGLVVEGPFVLLDPDGAPREEGIGDLAFAPRVLLVEAPGGLLSVSLEVEVPTGRYDDGLGRGEAALAPAVSWWIDLGQWVTWSTLLGTEHGTKRGEAELVYQSAFTWSMLGPAVFPEPTACLGAHDHEDRHFPPGMLGFVVELTGRTVLNRADRGRSTAEFLFGVTYALTGSWEVRAALQFPLWKPRELDNGCILGLVHHF